jgi:hypothetical protein
MDTHEPAKQADPLAMPKLDLHWRALMAKFEEACEDVVASLQIHETQRTQRALDALVRAELRRSMALNDMLDFLDGTDDRGKDQSWMRTSTQSPV